MLKILTATCFLMPFYANAWTKNVSVDKMTDEKAVIIAQNSKANVWAKKKAIFAISFRCGQPTKLLLLEHPWLVGNGPVQIRIDKHEAFLAYAKPQDGRHVFLIGDASGTGKDNPDNLIESISDGESMVIRYDEVGSGHAEAEFSIRGLKEQISSACPLSKQADDKT